MVRSEGLKNLTSLTILGFDSNPESEGGIQRSGGFDRVLDVIQFREHLWLPCLSFCGLGDKGVHSRKRASILSLTESCDGPLKRSGGFGDKALFAGQFHGLYDGLDFQELLRFLLLN